MSDAMAYNPAKPDSISVAGHITRYYRVVEGVKGEALGDIYREASEVGKRTLTGQKDLPIQDAIDLVEIVRVGKSVAKYIPRITGNMVAKSTDEFLDNPPRFNPGEKAAHFHKNLKFSWEGGRQEEVVEIGLIVADAQGSCQRAKMVSFRPDTYIVEGAYECIFPWNLIKIK